jgi:hypothetical protein
MLTAKFLLSAPKYSELKIAIQTMLDISMLTIKETRRFTTVDDEEMTTSEPVSNGGKLYFTNE